MFGIDTARARDLVHALDRWPDTIDEVDRTVRQAVTLSELDPGVSPHLDTLHTDGRSLSRSISAAVELLESHRTWIERPTLAVTGVGVMSAALAVGDDPDSEGTQTDGRPSSESAAVQRTIDRIRAATASGRAANPGDHARVRDFFHASIEDSAAASAALALALRGVPVREAKGYTSQAELEQLLNQVAVLMAVGRSPRGSGLPIALFPTAYVEWHDWAAEPTTGQEQGTAWPQLTTSPRPIDTGFGRMTHLVGTGRVSRFDAVASLAEHLRGVADRWAGQRLTDFMYDGSALEFVHLGRFVDDRRVVAEAFFAEIGPAAVTDIPWIAAREQVESVALPLFAGGLGWASRSPDLGFTARDLVNQDDANPNPLWRVGTGAPIEVLFSSPLLDREFALDGYMRSLALRGQSTRENWPTAPRPARGGVAYDPRQVTLQAAAEAELATTLVDRLSERGQLDLLLDANFAAPGPRANGGLFPAVSFFAAVATDPRLTGVVVDYLGEERLDPLQLGAESGLSHGVSAMLALRVDDYWQRERDVHRFLAAYEVALAGAAGIDVAGAANDLFRRETAANIDAGQLDVDQTDLAVFAGAVERSLFEAHRRDARLRDEALRNSVQSLSILLGVVSGVFGLTRATGRSTLATMFGIGLTAYGPKSEREIEVFGARVDALEMRPAFLRRDRLVAMFESGRVITDLGEPLAIEGSDSDPTEMLPTYVVTESATGTVLYRGNFVVDDGEPVTLAEFEALRFVPASGEPVPFRRLPDRYGSVDWLFDFNLVTAPD